MGVFLRLPYKYQNECDQEGRTILVLLSTAKPQQQKVCTEGNIYTCTTGSLGLTAKIHGESLGFGVHLPSGESFYPRGVIQHHSRLNGESMSPKEPGLEITILVWYSPVDEWM